MKLILSLALPYLQQLEISTRPLGESISGCILALVQQRLHALLELFFNLDAGLVDLLTLAASRDAAPLPTPLSPPTPP